VNFEKLRTKKHGRTIRHMTVLNCHVRACAFLQHMPDHTDMRLPSASCSRHFAVRGTSLLSVAGRAALRSHDPGRRLRRGGPHTGPIAIPRAATRSKKAIILYYITLYYVMLYYATLKKARPATAAVDTPLLSQAGGRSSQAAITPQSFDISLFSADDWPPLVLSPVSADSWPP
jgi:hypothetical protein